MGLLLWPDSGTWPEWLQRRGGGTESWSTPVRQTFILRGIRSLSISTHVEASGRLLSVVPLVAEPLSMAAAVDLAAKFKALADPVRLQLLQFGGQPCRW